MEMTKAFVSRPCQRFNVQVSGEAWVVPPVRHHKMERRSTFLLKRRRIDFHFVKSGTVMLRKLMMSIVVVISCLLYSMSPYETLIT